VWAVFFLFVSKRKQLPKWHCILSPNSLRFNFGKEVKWVKIWIGVRSTDIQSLDQEKRIY
jgi:hypothetical protein